jgi:Peptidase S46
LKKFLFVLAFFQLYYSHAQEGFWLPEALPDKWGKDFKVQNWQGNSSGKIFEYSDLIRAIVSLDNGNCSGAIISKNGLLLTNYHCLEPYLASLAQEGKIDLQNGYFVNQQNQGPELIGLNVDVPVGSIDLSEVTQDKIEYWIREKQNPIRKRIVRDFFPSKESKKGIITDVFTKITLVSAPPIALAELGGNEGNWQWPRYSSDFCLLRLHRSDPIHKRDYKSFPHFKIAREISKGKQIMVGGFPFKTFRNAYSRQIENLLLHDQSTRLKLRKKRLNIYSDYLEFNEDTKLPRELMKSLENEKIFQAREIQNVQQNGLIGAKNLQEKSLARKDKNLRKALENINLIYDSLEYFNLPRIYLNEGLTAPKIFLFVFGFSPFYDALQNQDKPDQIQKTLGALKQKSNSFFSNNDLRLEKELFFKMVMQYYEDMPPPLLNPNFKAIDIVFEGDVFRFVNEIWDNSMFTNEDMLNHFLDSPDQNSLGIDPMYQWVNEVINYYFISIAPRIKSFQAKLSKSEKEVLDLLEKTPYPEANGSIRISRGKVAGFQRNETDWSEPFCTVSGLKTTKNGESPPRVEEWIKTLEKDQMVSFLSEVEVTVGNSGSPILNLNGELIGLVFDQNIEGLGNRYYYDPGSQKCIGLAFSWIEKMVRELGDMPGFFEEEFNQ